MITDRASFRWNDPDHDDAESIVVPEQAGIAVYWNGRGEITLRQQMAWDEDADSLVLIAPQHGRAVAEAILRLVAEYEDEVWVQAFGPGGIIFLQHAAKRDRDRDPALAIHLVLACATEPTGHCPRGSLPVCRS